MLKSANAITAPLEQNCPFNKCIRLQMACLINEAQGECMRSQGGRQTILVPGLVMPRFALELQQCLRQFSGSLKGPGEVRKY